MLHCPSTHALTCFADDRHHGLADPLACFGNGGDARVSCSCVSPVFGPPKEFTTFAVALVIGGQTRSFTSAPVHSAFKTLVSKLPHTEAVMLAVLTTDSTNSRVAHLAASGSNRTTHFTTRKLDGVMQSFGLPWHARYLSDSSSLSEVAAACSNQQLRNLLMTASSAKTVQGGVHNSLIKRVIGFDLLLGYEQSARRAPERVIFLRPDMLYVFAPAAFAPNCSNGVYVRNDQFASMRRRLAGYYFTSYATDLSLHGVGIKPPNMTLLHQAKGLAQSGRSNIGGLTLMPHFHLAYYGVPFAGGGLEMVPVEGIDCAGYRPVMQQLAIRDLPNSDGTDVCYGPSSRQIEEVEALLARFNVSSCVK